MQGGKKVVGSGDVMHRVQPAASGDGPAPGGKLPAPTADSGDLNADVSERVVLLPDAAVWQPTPWDGISRLMLERIGRGRAQATSLVRFAPGASAPCRPLPMTKEVLVLEGTLVDEMGEHPAGTWLRTSGAELHAPQAPDGCLLFIKLSAADHHQGPALRVATHAVEWRPTEIPGVWSALLHQQDGMRTRLIRTLPDTWFGSHVHPGGEEILVIDGVLHDELGRYPRHTWLRNPRWTRHAPFTGSEGVLSLVKDGHLTGQAGPSVPLRTFGIPQA